MKRTIILVTAIVFCAIGSANGASFGGPGGRWSTDWPKELEPLRKQAWTWEHVLIGQRSFDIPFANRDEFEAAWLHILDLKSKESPLTLVRDPYYYGSAGDMAVGVIIFPPLESVSEGPSSTTRIFLKVDGKIVDLNRIPLPADTLIIDKRFDGK